VSALEKAYFRHAAPEDLADRSDADLAGAIRSHRELAATRPQETARIRVLTPTTAVTGWSAGGRSVIEIVTDDMPFLVDSVTMATARRGLEVHLVVHPVFDVVRDLTGDLQEVSPVADGAGAPADGAVRESWMHVEVDRVADETADELVTALRNVLQDVRDAVDDSARIRRRLAEISTGLVEAPPAGISPDEAGEAAALLDWLADDNFAFLGCRDYTLDGDYLRGVPGTGLGILRHDPVIDKPPMPRAVAAKAREKTVLVLAKSNSRATVARPAYLDHVGIKQFDERGEVVGERRFLGLFTNRATSETITRIPVLRVKAREVFKRSGFDPESHDGKVLLDTLESYPRSELFHTTTEDLEPMARAAMAAQERRTLKVFLRPDTYGRYVSVMVSLPRDRYSTTVRERFARILTEELGAEDLEFTVRISDSTTARVHFVVHVPHGSAFDAVEARGGDIERKLQVASRSWRDDLVSAVIAAHGEQAAAGLSPILDTFPEAYKEDFEAAVGAEDAARLAVLSPGEVDLAVYAEEGSPAEEARLKVFRVGERLSLSQVLPMLTSLGLEVTDERPYEFGGRDRGTYIYDFGLRAARPFPHEAPDTFCAALRAMWDGRSEVDGFNELVLAADLDHRQVSVLRAYAKYMRQGGTPFAESTISAALVGNVGITQQLVELFRERFDPAGPAPELRAEREAALTERILASADEVASLDQDRILRSYLVHVQATLRTNYFRERSYLSLKMEPAMLPDLPQPRPAYEIFVYSPLVEGVHLRFGLVARGGLRWSDRRDDFRTEILGLVKSQQVKNTVIVPVGAKGGFVAKGVEGPTAYTTFIRGLLDVTDNRVDGKTLPPPDVVRHDGEDSYLVVAADKGTATYSDLANTVAKEYEFWLGDAFASGGSAGYDHKAMGITARGAWVSVQRHFREMGVDCQREDFTCVGIGDMSGDVFGNGMLLSEHIRLVAAFDHRDIFLDPDPDAAGSFAERQRLFDLGQSGGRPTWQDYDRGLISAGGGVYSRQLKAVPVSEPVRRALGLDEGVERMTPAELIHAILQAPVDLLWNGGIGTYVKASDEPHAAAGDKANDAIRIDGAQLRARCVGEGGNLGLTQAGRVEYALVGCDGQGGRINTDFIDNTAGVDTSDHEVNLKILLNRVVTGGTITAAERDELLVEMTDEVAALVLHDNEQQNLAIANAAANARSLLHVHESWMRELERRGVIDREVEGLPSRAEVRRRLDAGGALTAPELAVLMSWTKIELARELAATDLPDDPFFTAGLPYYFPELVRDRFPEAIAEHPLRREIVVTQMVNGLVNGAGMTFWPRLVDETGASVAELVGAYYVAREIYGAAALRKEIAGYDNVIDAAVQTRMRIQMRTLVERTCRWLVAQRLDLSFGEAVERFRDPVRAVMDRLPELLTGTELHAFEGRRDRLVAADVPEDLAVRVATLDPAYVLPGVVEVARERAMDPADVTREHFLVGERLGLAVVLSRIVALPRDDAWQSMARAAIREDLHAVHTGLTSRAIADPTWLDSDEVARAADTLRRVCAEEPSGSVDLARISVGLRVARGLL